MGGFFLRARRFFFGGSLIPAPSPSPSRARRATPGGSPSPPLRRSSPSACARTPRSPRARGALGPWSSAHRGALRRIQSRRQSPARAPAPCAPRPPPPFMSSGSPTTNRVTFSSFASCARSRRSLARSCPSRTPRGCAIDPSSSSIATPTRARPRSSAHVRPPATVLRLPHTHGHGGVRRQVRVSLDPSRPADDKSLGT